MAIPIELLALIDRLNQELAETERDATNGINILRPILFRFPDNDIMTQFFAYFNTAIFFVSDSKGRIQTTVDRILSINVTEDETQEVGEELGTLLGVTLEIKAGVRRILNILEELP